jgi:hypothetical protein
MEKKNKIELTEEQLGVLLDRLRRSPQGDTSMHISDEQMVAYALDDLLPPDKSAVLQHLQGCPACAGQLEALVNQARLWESSSGKEGLELRRRELRRSTREKLAPRTSLLERLARELDKIVLRPPMTLAPGYARAATPAIGTEGQSESGLLQWYYGPDEEGNLVIRVSSFDIQLEGVRVTLRAGGWQRQVELLLVESEQVGVETVIAAEELEEIDLSNGLRFELSA